VVQDAAVAVEVRAPEPVESGAPKIMEDSIKKGAAIGAIPLLACVMTYACPPDALLAGAALLVGRHHRRRCRRRHPCHRRRQIAPTD
jgi:hypothetical protein